MIVIGEASSVIALVQLGQLSLLKKLYTEVYIPHLLYAEVMPIFSDLALSSSDLLLAVKNREIQVRSSWEDEPVSPHIHSHLTKAEADAVNLAFELGNCYLLASDRIIRKEAKAAGIISIGLLGLLHQARKSHLIDALTPLLDQLRSKLVQPISERLYTEVLQSIHD
ncbi:hypothetical protein [Arsenicibacter rosenii]|uniref:Nucleic acid-binding protein n=1 Tax=Arsenicibacter rosenii TaxID=1750698 RepID=A0A1S2VDG8_9BACT|nr:hypothetical protein [Arsenicibacter rosenii]OIN56817.1 hypothetical protein BLX24_22860 [Arsenicibacter rosenii]